MNSSETIRSLAYISPIFLIHQVIWKGVYAVSVCFQAFCLSIVNVPNAFLASFPGFPGK